MTYFMFLFGILITIIAFSTIVVFGQTSENVSELLKKGGELALGKQYDNALPYFDKVLEIDPQNLDALKAKGFILIFTRDFEEASLILDKVLELDPNDRRSLELKVVALGSIGKSEDTEPFLLRISEINQNIESLISKGREYYESSELEEALSYYDSALKLDPDNITAFNAKAVIFFDLGKWEESIISIRKAESLAPDNPEIQRNSLAILFGIPRDSYPTASVKIQIRDSDGGLLGYQEVIGIGIFNNTLSKEFLKTFEVKKIINQEGQDYEVLEFRVEGIVPEAKFYNMAQISAEFGESKLPALTALHHGIPAQKGDTLTEVWTLLRPIG